MEAGIKPKDGIVTVPTEGQKAHDRLVHRVLAGFDAVIRTKAALDGEVKDDLAVKEAAWRKALEDWNLLPHKLLADRRQAKELLAAEAREARKTDGEE